MNRDFRTEYNASKEHKEFACFGTFGRGGIVAEQVDFPSPLTLDPAMLMETALASRPDLAAAIAAG